MADGLTAELQEYLLDAIGAPYRDRLVSSEQLVVDYASTHTLAEDAVEREASAATYAILRRALSNEVITPGRTTLMDVQYWITAEWKRQGFEFNFPASLEFAITVPVPEWDDQPVTIMREEDTLVTADTSPEYLSGPQTELWVIH